MKIGLLATISSTHITQKTGDILLVQNSPLTRLPACVMFFGCEMRPHFVARHFYSEQLTNLCAIFIRLLAPHFEVTI